MNVTCPRCGARQELQSETRFYTCSYCRSTFAVAGGVRVAEYRADIQTDERSAWSVLADYLEQGGHRALFRRGSCVMQVCPFWLVRRRDGGTLFRPAAALDVPVLEQISLPGCDLVPLGDPSPAQLPPDQPLEQILDESGLSPGECQVSLVQLPLQIVEYEVDGVDYRCTVIVADWKLYADRLPPLESTVASLPGARYLVAYVTLLLIVAVLIRHHLVRGAVFALLLLAAWLIARRTLTVEAGS